MSNTLNENALNRFIANVSEIETKLELINTYCVEDHFGKHPDRVDWATVGSAAHVNNMLDDLIEFLGLKKEG